MKNMMKKISVLLSALAILAWGGVTVGCSDGSDNGDYDPKALEGLWIDSEDDANAVCFENGKAYFDLQKGEDGTYSSAEDGAPYTVKGDVITAGDETATILDMRVKDYVKLSTGGETATYKYSDKKLSSGGASGGEDGDKYDYKQELSKSDKTPIYFEFGGSSGHIVKSVSFEYRADEVANGIDINGFIQVGEWKFIKLLSDKEGDTYPKLGTDWKTFKSHALPDKGQPFTSEHVVPGEGNGEGESNADLCRVGMEVDTSTNGGNIYIKNFKVIDQDDNEIDFSGLELKVGW